MAKPKIRFNGYTEDWEQRKVSELCSISTGKSNTQDKVEDGEYPFYVRSPIIERSTKYLYDEEAVITVGDGVGTGKVFHYVNGKYDLHQRCYRMYGFSDELNAHYFYHTFSKLFYKRVMAMTAKTSVDSVRLEMISDMKIPVPNVEEQRKIGNLLDGIDHLITLHQRKCEQTKTLKKYMLQKMFPQDGEKVPQIRFEGFTEDWEQRKLGEIADLTSSKRVHAQDYVDSGIPFYRGKEISELREHKPVSEVLYITEEKYKEMAKLYGSPQVGDLLITAVGTIGNTWVVDNVPFYFKDGNLIWFKNIKCNPNYLDYVLSSDDGQKKIDASAIGSSQKALTMVKMNELKFMFPNNDEQVRIADYFRNLDNLITLHQRKCDELKEVKKFMLQNMFV